jgi:Na+-translocating ferredoxin:NAD+ oxidoreductase RnfG subunit
MLAALASLAAPPCGAAVFLTQAQALAEAFPRARCERRSFALTPEQARAVESRARVRLPSRLVTAYAAWRGDTLAGAAFFESRTVRTMPGVFMVVVAPDTTVARVEVLAFHEPPDYQPPARWLAGFAGRGLDDQLWPGRGLHHLAGATLSARAVTESTRLALALYETVVAPAIVAGGR